MITKSVPFIEFLHFFPKCKFLQVVPVIFSSILIIDPNKLGKVPFLIIHIPVMYLNQVPSKPKSLLGMQFHCL